jgi:hypothetical protein
MQGDGPYQKHRGPCSGAVTCRCVFSASSCCLRRAPAQAARQRQSSQRAVMGHNNKERTKERAVSWGRVCPAERSALVNATDVWKYQRPIFLGECILPADRPSHHTHRPLLPSSRPNCLSHQTIQCRQLPRRCQPCRLQLRLACNCCLPMLGHSSYLVTGMMRHFLSLQTRSAASLNWTRFRDHAVC